MCGALRVLNAHNAPHGLTIQDQELLLNRYDILRFKRPPLSERQVLALYFPSAFAIDLAQTVSTGIFI